MPYLKPIDTPNLDRDPDHKSGIVMSPIVHSGLSRTALAFGREALFCGGSGGYATDEAGREFVDFTLGYGSVVLGHSNADFLAGVQRYAHEGLMLPGYSPRHVDLLGILLGPDGASQSAAFFKTGSEAVLAAVRLATSFSARAGVLRCGFIGWHDVELARSVRWHEILASPLRSIERFTDRAFRGSGGHEFVMNWESLQIEDLALLLSTHGDRIGCFVLDAYQSRFVDLSVLVEAIAMCREYGISIIVDETKLSGRFSPLGLNPRAGWNADLYVIGKALANGAPISILYGAPKIMSLSERLRVTGTFSQELGAIHCALATADQMEKRDGYDALRSIGSNVSDAFNVAVGDVGLQGELHAEPLFGGAMFEIVFSASNLADWDRREALRHGLADQGILILQGHCSYVCLDHIHLDFEKLRMDIRAGLVIWRDSRSG